MNWVFSQYSAPEWERNAHLPNFPSRETAGQTGSCGMSLFRKIAIAGVAAAALAAAAATPAEARWGGGGWHGGWHRGGGWGWGAGAFAGGLALGALATSPYYYGGPYYGYYGGGCYFRNRVVGYTAYGRPIVRPVRVCY
jgi:hypothetical protein